MKGGVFGADLDEAEARALIDAGARDGRARPRVRRDAARAGGPGARPPAGDGPRIAMIDTGVKLSIVRNLRARGATVELHPVHGGPRSCSRIAPTPIFLANGPGDPGALDYIVDTVRGLIGKLPVYGICLGHQLLCRAVGLETYKLPFGHHGANHPVKDLTHRSRRDHQPEPRLRGARPRRVEDDRRRRGGPLGDRLRRGRADSYQSLRPHRRGAWRCATSRARPSSTTPRPAPARTTRCTCSTGSSRRSRRPPSDAPPRRHPQDPRDRIGADRDRPGGRVRLLGHAGVPGADRGGLRGRARQLEPGDDHDRSRARHRHLRRAAAARAR